MKSRKDGCGYNERLFSGGLRSKLHLARFKWLQTQLKKLSCPLDSVLELGCFDGKLIDFLPSRPSRYVGFDANWEGGLDSAKSRWADSANFSFVQASAPAEMLFSSAETFEIAVSMETLEHIPPHMIDGYFLTIAQHLNGYFFITVPNEKGVVFLAKWLAKNIFSKDAEPYTVSELVNATLGRMERVPRNEHKGFDYHALIRCLEQHFDLVEVSGFPLGLLPNSFCFGIGIVLKSKATGSHPDQ